VRGEQRARKRRANFLSFSQAFLGTSVLCFFLVQPPKEFRLGKDSKKVSHRNSFQEKKKKSKALETRLCGKPGIGKPARKRRLQGARERGPITCGCHLRPRKAEE